MSKRNLLEEVVSLQGYESNELLAIIGAQLRQKNSVIDAIGLDKADMRLLDDSMKSRPFGGTGSGLARGSFKRLTNKIADGIAGLTDDARKFIDAKHAELRKAVCEDFEYCKKSQEFGQKWELVAQVAAAIEQVLPGISGPVIAVYLAKEGLDVFCGC